MQNYRTCIWWTQSSKLGPEPYDFIEVKYGVSMGEFDTSYPQGTITLPDGTVATKYEPYPECQVEWKASFGAVDVVVNGSSSPSDMCSLATRWINTLFAKMPA